MIELRQVEYAYQPDQKVLGPVDLELATGEVTALVGHNGSGKSTLGRLLNGLLLPSRGLVSVDGLLTSTYDPEREVQRRVGMVFQDPNSQLVAQTVEDEIAFGPENLSWEPERIEKRVQEMIRDFDLEVLRARDPHLCSGGQKQKIALAAVLAMQPRFLVLDEATSMLDPSGRRSFLRAIEKLRRETELGILMITHDSREVLMADRVVVLEQGEVVDDFREPGQSLERLLKAGFELPPLWELYRRFQQRQLELDPRQGERFFEQVERLCQS